MKLSRLTTLSQLLIWYVVDVSLYGMLLKSIDAIEVLLYQCNMLQLFYKFLTLPATFDIFTAGRSIPRATGAALLRGKLDSLGQKDNNFAGFISTNSSYSSLC